MTSNRTIRNLVIEEIDRATYRSIDLNHVLERSEIRALRIVEAKARSLNEQDMGKLLDLAWSVLKSKVGRKILVSLLKVVSKVLGVTDLAINKIAVPTWQKAIDFLKEKGIRVPFSAQQLYDSVKYMIPQNLAKLAADELIELLDGMSDDHYHEIINKGSGESASSKPSVPQDMKDSDEPGAKIATESYVHIIRRK